jgi:arylsulfatase A-like enzyme
MLTGVHPAVHGCYSGNFGPRIRESLVTLPELLARNGYSCSGCVSAENLSPEIGYGRGFDRYELQPMSWETRDFDARSNVNAVIDWVTRDAELPDRLPFYFLHIFDAHYPYIPPLPLPDDLQLDYRSMERFIEHVSYRDYLKLLKEDPLDIDTEALDLAKEYYRLSLSHVSRQLTRLIGTLKAEGIFDQSLIVVTGDHGEDFYERNFVFHHSLYDPNIRPAMIVKPPKDSEIIVPDDPDTVDFLPVIADLIGCEVPDQCAGRKWNETREERPRITERLLDVYNVSVEIAGVKGIFTYDENNPNRPTEAQIDSGPIMEEYYRVESGRTRNREVAQDTVPDEIRTNLRTTAERFMRQQTRHARSQPVKISADVTNRLKDLGYR